MGRIIIENLIKTFNNKTIIGGINVEFSGGKVYGIVGKNGAGKSIFLKLLPGAIRPTSGDILYEDFGLDKHISARL